MKPSFRVFSQIGRITGLLLFAAGMSSCALVFMGDDGSNGVDSSLVSGVPVTISMPRAAYANGVNWMDYVLPNGNPCVGNENGYTACIHGGETREVEVPGFSSCAGLSMTDALGVFQWT